jgi:hypothetical protein
LLTSDTPDWIVADANLPSSARIRSNAVYLPSTFGRRRYLPILFIGENAYDHVQCRGAMKLFRAFRTISAGVSVITSPQHDLKAVSMGCIKREVRRCET